MASASLNETAKEESNDDVKLSSIKRLLERRKFEDLNLAIRDAQNSKILHDHGWDLVPLVCSLAAADRGFAEACANTLKNLSKVGNPKELLVALLEQMDFLEANHRFQLLLGAIQTVLVRLSTDNTARFHQSLSWVLGALDKHMTCLPIPTSHGLEDKARMLQDSDRDVMQIEEVIGDLIEFYQPFLRDLLSAQNSSSSAKVRIVLSGFLVQILQPLAHVDVATLHGIPKGTLRLYAEKIVSDFTLLETNFYQFYDRIQRQPVGDVFTGNVSLQALGTLLYIVFVEGHHKDSLPCIYSHRYTFEASLPAILNLLRESPASEFKTAKGLSLCEHLLKCILNKQLESELLDLTTFTDLALSFEHIAVYESRMDSRRLAIKLLPQLIDKFDDRGRCRFVYGLLTAVGHSGVKGVVVSTFKQYVYETLLQTTSQSSQPPWLCGTSMRKMVTAIAALPEGVETDLMDDGERILSALNFLRFVFLRDDAQCNVTGIWNASDVVRRDFLDVLLKALDISRAHYELELKNQSQKSESKKKNAGPRFNLPPMSPMQTIHCLRGALTRMDLIQGLVIRVLEIMDGKK